jgi:hypothetical protein
MVLLEEFRSKTSRPDALVMDDNPQAMEAGCILPIVKGIRSGSLKRVLIIGNPQQLPPTRLNPRNAAAKNGEVSMMERLEAAGFPVIRLQVQYRMPAVAAPASSIPPHKRKRQLTVTAPPAASPWQPSHPAPHPEPGPSPAPVSVSAPSPAPALGPIVPLLPPGLTRDQILQVFQELEQQAGPEMMKELSRRYW